VLLYEKGCEKESSEFLKSYKDILKGEVIYHYILGEIAYKEQQYQKVYDEFMSIHENDFSQEIMPMDRKMIRITMLKELGIASLFLKKYTTADTCFMECINLDPLNIEMYHYAALAKEMNGDIDGAIFLCREGKNIDLEESLAKRIFSLKMKKGDIDAAIEEYIALGQTKADIDTITGMFSIACQKMYAQGIEIFYNILQSRLNLPETLFPENINDVREKIKNISSTDTAAFFETGISKLTNAQFF